MWRRVRKLNGNETLAIHQRIRSILPSRFPVGFLYVENDLSEKFQSGHIHGCPPCQTKKLTMMKFGLLMKHTISNQSSKNHLQSRYRVVT